MALIAELRISDVDLIDRLRGGDEDAFVWMVNTYGGSLKRLALAFVSVEAVADEVVQETWLAVITGISRFEGRSSVKTWLYKILTNRAKTRAMREKRTIVFSELDGASPRGEAAVDPERFLPADHPVNPGHWASPPDQWSGSAEDEVVGREMMEVLRRGLDALPPAQRAVVSLRDVHGWPAAQVCEALALSEANQRVLLHRGRSRLRGVLEDYFAGKA
jgi:RNA polymerase sigma-70 factor (ECF subfamily)